jgi:hypothetical protein
LATGQKLTPVQLGGFMFSLVTTAFLLASASSQTEPATASTPSAPAPATATAPAPREKKVCRREQLIGSIMPTRTCRTQAEWAAIDRAAQSDTDAQLRDFRSQHSN